MAQEKKVPRAKKKPIGDYAVGYARPPVKTQAKPGQILNPFGRNGKPKAEPDAFDRVMNKTAKVTIDGELFMMPSEEVMYMRLIAEAHKGKVSAAGLLIKEAARRRRNDPLPPTAEELAAEAAELEQKQALSAQLVALLVREASRKKAEGEAWALDDGKN